MARFVSQRGGYRRTIKVEGATPTSTVWITLDWMYLAANDGSAFAVNHSTSEVHVNLSVENERERYVIISASAGSAWTRNEGDKLAREFIRKHELSELQFSLASAYELLQISETPVRLYHNPLNQ